MGSSYRQDLNNGHMPEWRDKLYAASSLIGEVRDDLLDFDTGGQFDNAADDGALAEKLRIIIMLIEEEMPLPENIRP